MVHDRRHRQHGGRGGRAGDGHHLVDIGQAVDQGDGLVGVGAVIGDDQLERAAGAGLAAGIDLIHRHLQAFDGGRADEGVDPGEGHRHADRDLLRTGGGSTGNDGQGGQDERQFHGGTPCGFAKYNEIVVFQPDRGR